jgi:hypothetical protein
MTTPSQAVPIGTMSPVGRVPARNDAQANAFNDLVVEGKRPSGNTAMLVGAPRAGMARQA